jgi:hypothetical protein
MKRWLALLLIGTALVLPLESVELHDLQLHLGELFIANTYHSGPDGETVQGSDISPLNFSLGVAGRLDFTEQWRFRPELRFYWQEYLLAAGDKAVPTQTETGSQVGDVAGTLGLLVRFPLVYEWVVSDTWTFGAGASPTIHARFPMTAIEGSELGGLYRYFWGGGRFISPEGHGYLSYRVSDTIRVGLSLSALIPWHNLWTDVDTSFVDESLLNLSATIHYAWPD